MQIKRRTAATFLLPAIPLALVEVPPFQRRNELLRCAFVVAVIGLGMASASDDGAVVKIVVPKSIHSVAALFRRTDELRFLRFVLRNDICAAPRRSTPNGHGNGR